MRIECNEFVLPFREGWSSHASHLTVLPDGRIFCVFFYGSGEGNNDVRIWGAMREPGIPGKWSGPVPLTPDDGMPHWNPVLFTRNDGTVILFYKVGRTIPGWRTWYIESTDGCLTWSEPCEMIPGDNSGGRGPVRNKAICLADGTILAPGSTEGDAWRCFIDRSTDNGRSWTRSDDLCIPHTRLAVPIAVKSITWCDPYSTELPSNNSAIDVERLPDGRLVLAYNPVGKNWGLRSPRSLSISSDNGESWQHLTHLVTGTVKHAFAYPALVYAQDALHLTFTWCRQSIVYMRLCDI